MSILSLRNKVEQLKGEKALIEKSILEAKNRKIEKRKDLVRHEQAREIIREVGIKTQEQLQYHISDITSLALEGIFEDPYELVVEFVQRRNKTECDLYFKREGELINPVMASGGGAVDVAAFALRVASWSMKYPRTRNTIILDEPMRFLSEEYQGKAAEMLKQISTKLGLQFIIITHEPILATFADKVFETRIKNGKTKIIRI